MRERLRESLIFLPYPIINRKMTQTQAAQRFACIVDYYIPRTVDHVVKDGNYEDLN